MLLRTLYRTLTGSILAAAICAPSIASSTITLVDLLGEPLSGGIIDASVANGSRQEEVKFASLPASEEQRACYADQACESHDDCFSAEFCDPFGELVRAGSKYRRAGTHTIVCGLATVPVRRFWQRPPNIDPISQA